MDTQRPGDLACRVVDLAGNLERDARRPVAELRALRRLERDPTGRLGEAGLGECGAHGFDELIADHEGGRVARAPVSAS